jgi:hypothetical protein
MNTPIKTIPRFVWQIPLLVAASLILGGWMPPAASLQNAHMVGDEQVRVAGSWYGLKDTGEGGEKLTNTFAGLLGVGLNDRTELQFRFDHFDFSDSDVNYEFVSVGAKVGLIEDRLALVLPLGMYARDGIEWSSVQIHPGAVGTLQAGQYVEVNASGKILFPFDQDNLIWFNLGVGVGFSTDLDRWAILPEIGYSVCLDEGEVDPVFSYGFSFVFLPAP